MVACDVVAVFSFGASVLLSPQETLLGCISEMLGNITNSTKMLENGGWM